MVDKPIHTGLLFAIHHGYASHVYVRCCTANGDVGIGGSLDRNNNISVQGMLQGTRFLHYIYKVRHTSYWNSQTANMLFILILFSILQVQ